MDCSSIAADGSDFRITGPAAVNIKSAFGVCSNGDQYNHDRIILTKPIRVNGNFTITLKKWNRWQYPMLDECGFVTPAGSTLPFTTKKYYYSQFPNCS
jgi:hypothetical protein